MEKRKLRFLPAPKGRGTLTAKQWMIGDRKNHVGENEIKVS